MNEHSVYIGIGTNIGDRKQNIRSALLALSELGTVAAISRCRRTKPYGVIDQPDFINLAVLLETALSPTETLRAVQQIETELGRIRTRYWGERTVDLDILFYDNLIVETPELTVPHPDLQNRSFVLEPLCDIAPNLTHPVLDQTIIQLYRQLLK